jgi:hypothetical protein
LLSGRRYHRHQRRRNEEPRTGNDIMRGGAFSDRHFDGDGEDIIVDPDDTVIDF